MADELVSPRITPGEMNAMQRPLELDLMAWYAALRDELLLELRKSKSPEDFLARVRELLAGEEWLGAVNLLANELW